MGFPVGDYLHSKSPVVKPNNKSYQAVIAGTGRLKAHPTFSGDDYTEFIQRSPVQTYRDNDGIQFDGDNYAAKSAIAFLVMVLLELSETSAGKHPVE